MGFLAQADGMANLLLVLACVFVLAALVLQGCLTETGNKAEIQAENETENATENATERLFSVGDGPLPALTPTKYFWSHTGFVVAAVAAGSIVGMLGAAASRRVPEGDALAPDSESAAE